MCFDNEGDWCASYQTDERKILDKPSYCVECGRVILLGEIVREIHQRENEQCECVWCEQQEYPDPDYDGPTECLKDFGEQFDCLICSDCCNLLQAIYEQELAEGCPEHARQPLFGQLHEVFYEHEQAFEYATKAVDLYPELYEHFFIRNLLEAA